MENKEKMRTIELFSGTKSFSKVAAKLGHDTLTIDNDPSLKPDIVADIKGLIWQPLIDLKPDILWASPPCTTFSVASISHYWKDGKPKNQKALDGIALLDDTIRIIQGTNPTYWFIENPRGMMRKVIDEIFLKYDIQGYKRVTVSYCQYGAKIMKPTDIWTNCKEWIPKPICKPGANCHQKQPRSYGAKLAAGVLKQGTQGKKDATARGEIPADLFKEIFKSLIPPR